MLRVKFSVKSALSQGAPTPLVYLSSCDLEALTVSSIFPSNFGNPRDFSFPASLLGTFSRSI